MKIGIQIETDRQVKALKAELKSTTNAFVRQVAEDVADQARVNLRGHDGPDGRIRISSRRTREGEALVEARGPGAKAQERGAYIKPKRRQVLKFEIDGQTVYTAKPVKIKAKRYLARASASAPRLVEHAFRMTFGRRSW